MKILPVVSIILSIVAIAARKNIQIYKPLLCVTLVTFFSANSDAALVITFSQEGNDALITAKGDVDISGLGSPIDFLAGPFSDLQNNQVFDHVWSGIDVDDDRYVLGPSEDLFSIMTGTKVFGSSSGDRFGIGTSDSGFSLYFEDGFSGGGIDGSLIIPDVDLSNYRPRDFRFMWGTGDNQVLIVNGIPEPSSLFLILCGAGLFMQTRHRS